MIIDSILKFIGYGLQGSNEIVEGIGGKRTLYCNGFFFCSIPLFQDLVKKGICATSTIRCNCIGLPSHLKNTKAWKNCE
jgi:hypothetical protein